MMSTMVESVPQTRSRSVHKSMSYVFGTLAEIVIVDDAAPRARKAAAAVLDGFDRLHRKFHPWNPGELVALNEAIAASRGRIKADPEIGAMIRRATQLSVRSGALFNPAIGGLVRLWSLRDGEHRSHLPDRADIQHFVMNKPQMTDLVLHEAEIMCEKRSVQLDFGGYAKGYALDRAARRLKAHGIEHALLNVGGHITALGCRGERPWSVGIRHSRRSGLLARIELHDGETISTSGDYERYFVVNGTRYAHIIDPRTGYPARGTRAATVVTSAGPDAGALADAASGALFIAGPQEWRGVAERMGVGDAMLVDERGAIHVMGEMQERLELLQTDY